MQLVRVTHVKATADYSPQGLSCLMLMVTNERRAGQVSKYTSDAPTECRWKARLVFLGRVPLSKARRKENALLPQTHLLREVQIMEARRNRPFSFEQIRSASVLKKHLFIRTCISRALV